MDAREALIALNMVEHVGPVRLRHLLDHFGDVDDPREPEKVKYPRREVLFMVTCATIAGCDDYDTKPIDLERLLPKIQKFLPPAPAAPPAA